MNSIDNGDRNDQKRGEITDNVPANGVAPAESSEENSTIETPSPPSLFDGRNDSLNLDGALYRIMEYLTPSDFYTLGAQTGSRFWKQFLFENPHSEYLFSPPDHPNASKGRTHLKNLHYFRTSVEAIPRGRARKGLKRNRRGSKLQQQQQCPQSEEEQQSLNRVGIFSSQEEDSILSNDTNGYFGLAFFRPGVLAVWGDYSGMFLTPYVDRLFASENNKESPPEIETRVCTSDRAECETKKKKEEEEKKETSSLPSTAQNTKTMGKEGCGYLFPGSCQVMAVLTGFKPYVFFGFALGTIHSIDSRPMYKEEPSSSSSSGDPTTRKYPDSVEYYHVSECRYHCQRGEISSLASVENCHMVSSSMRVNAVLSEILIHWNALKDGNLQNISRIKIDAETFHVRGPHFLDEIWDVSPLDMASSSCLPQWKGPVLSIGARGQNLTHLCLWSADEPPEIPRPDLSTENKSDNPPPIFTPSKSFRNCIFRDEYRMYRARRARNRRCHHFVYLKYFQETNLVIGTSKGDILRIEMDKRYMSNKKANKSILYNCCTGGMVEAVELVGKNKPIMITGGGYDGRIRFWDWKSFESLGSLRIHPGQQALATEAALAASSSRLVGSSATAMPIAHHRYSPVVSTFFCHERSSLVSFCRDGHLHEWRVEDVAKKLKRANIDMSPSPKRKSKQESMVNSPSRSTRAHAHYEIGTIVRKRHGDNNIYEGSITSFDPVKELYKIKYENGDTAECKHDEVKRMYKHEQKYSSQKYTKAICKLE